VPDVTSRRAFLKAGSAAGVMLGASRLDGAQATRPRAGDLARLMTAPVLRRELLPSPVRIESIELIKAGDQFLVRARSTDGAIGTSVGHPDVLQFTSPILARKVAPFFVKKDARDLETLLDELYIASSNYKWQGLPFWVPVASVEIALLDLLGHVAGKPIGELFGPIVKRDIAVYRASGNRGNSAEAELDYLQKLVGEIGARAIKFRLGARMRYDDASTKRDVALIPLTRKTFGAGMAIHADANSSYDVQMALRIGRLMHEQKFAFFEEPVPFDFYDETKEVADALTLPVAGGEQDSSLRRFRWMIEHRGVDIVQPDIFYFGGFVRSIRVARMAAAAGMECTPHMSDGGLGYLYVAHFASCVPNAGPFQEYKGRDKTLPVSSDTSTLNCVNGVLKVPSGPGLGVTIDPAFVAKGELIR
jgi:L-alanine-DL-glutamate epimerase-like enolase superfamily enzyme